MPRRGRRGRKSKYVTKRGLPFQLMKYAETKHKDTTFAQQNLVVPCNLLDAVFPLSNISTGSAQTNRTGNECQISGVYIRLICEAALTGTAQYLRAILYTPRVVTNLECPSTSVTAPVDHDEWIIWFDRTVLCTFTQGAGGQGVLVIRKKFKPYMKALFDTGLGGSQVKGNILLALIGLNTLGTSVQGHCRLYFKDL